MIEFSSYRPNPLAPMILVNKIGGIYRLGGLVKVTFVLEAPGPSGVHEAIERGSLLWEPADVHSANEQFTWAFEEIKRGTFVPHDGGRRSRAQ